MYNIYLFIKSLLNSFSDIILLSEKKKPTIVLFINKIEIFSLSFKVLPNPVVLLHFLTAPLSTYLHVLHLGLDEITVPIYTSVIFFIMQYSSSMLYL